MAHRQKDHTERTLTSRQRDVLKLLAEGFRMHEAAAVLNVTPRTIAFHKYRAMRAAGLRNNSELVQYAINNRLIKPKR